MLLRPDTRLWTPGQFKPSGLPQIDWGHPLAQGLLFYAFDTGLGVVLDLVTGRPQVQPGSVTLAGPAASPFGTGLLWNASDSRTFNSDAAIRAATATGNYSLATGYVQTGSVAGNSVIFGRYANNGGSAPFVNWGIGANFASAGQNVIGFAYSDGGTLTFGPQCTVAPSNAYVGACAVASGGGTASTMYTQGVLQNANSATAINSVDTGDPVTFASSGFIGQVFFGAFWNRPLNAAENLQLYLDPYCFLRPPEGEMAVLFTSDVLMAQACM